MLHQLQQIDTQWFVWLNGCHAPWADRLMYWATQRNSWLWLYALVILGLIWQYKNRAAGMIGILILTVFAADQLTSSVLKPWVERLRPCYVTYLKGQVHLVVESCGGTYGFASSHAANSFGFAVALWLLVGQRFGWVGWLFFPWAAMVSYSRIYVGVHYPLDVVAGAFIGIGVAYVLVKLLHRPLPHKVLKTKQNL